MITLTGVCLLQRPMGLLSLLDEESKFPRSTDHSLAGELVMSGKGGGNGVGGRAWESRGSK